MSLYTVYCDNVLDTVDQIAKDYMFMRNKRKKQIEKCVYYYYDIA